MGKFKKLQALTLNLIKIQTDISHKVQACKISHCIEVGTVSIQKLSRHFEGEAKVCMGGLNEVGAHF